MDCIKCWIDTLACSFKDNFVVLLILQSEKQLLDMYKCLDTWKDKPDFEIHQCIFKKDKSEKNSENFNENVLYSVIFGRLNIFEGQILALNENIDKDLKKVVSKLTPPSGRVAYLSRGDKKVTQIHENYSQATASEVEYTYFVSQVEVQKVREVFFLVPESVKRSLPKVTGKESVNDETNRDSGDSDQESDTDHEFVSGDASDVENKVDDQPFLELDADESLIKSASTSSTKYK